ncbi:MAG TPA: hypothetical protein VGP22_14980 [Albitalea sp.]|nr:hypothetical protein [Albitalea sp.]
MKSTLSWLLLGLAASVPAHALDAAEERAERQRIQSERVQVDAAYLQRERDCRARFVVTACLEGAQRDRRQAVERLRQQQVILDEAQRKQRAAQRMDDIRNKVSGQDASRREAIMRDRRSEKQRAEVVAHSSPTAQPSEAPAAATPASAAASEATQRVTEREKREAQARGHREAVERRNAERLAQGKRPARPLPVPAASAASASPPR